ncbi:putative RNA-directed DNA polymerase from transposon X-element [Exaiptasia diaphana]|nr:putative RNA-directed DNA polymerase from transposon X-element [Exaiptasia diaphana]
MYADDTSISFAAQTKHELQTLINRELSNVNIWLKSNKLSLNVAKTEFMTIGSRQRLMTQANAPIDIHIESSKIKQVSKTKSIGVIIDETLSWAEHVNYISKKISSAIGALKRVRCFIDQATAAKIYKAIIEPHFNYCSPVFDGISQKLDDKLQKLQNRAARIVTRSSFDESAKPLLDMLGWDTVSVAREKQKAITMFKSVNSLAPKYLMDMFSYRQSLYNFRNSENILNVPKPRTNYLKRSLGDGIVHKLDAFFKHLFDEIEVLYLSGVSVSLPRSLTLESCTIPAGEHRLRAVLLLGTADLKAHQDIALYAGGSYSILLQNNKSSYI